jgi:hypothetical protein
VSTVNSQTPVLFATNGTTIVVNGNYTTDAGLYGGMLIGNYGDASMETGTYIFKGAFDENTNGGKLFDFGSGNIILDTSATGYTTASGTVYSPMVFVGAGANLPQTLLTEGAQTIRNGIYNQGASNAIIGGSDASASTFSGYINAGGSGGELDLRAAANGTVTFSGQIDGNNGATTKDGAGTLPRHGQHLDDLHSRHLRDEGRHDDHHEHLGRCVRQRRRQQQRGCCFRSGRLRCEAGGYRQDSYSGSGAGPHQ